MILVNGSKGIGTGFSTDIMCYNPLQIIEYLKNKLRYIEPKVDVLEPKVDVLEPKVDDIEFLPYYEGFKGNITKISNDRFLIKGIYENIGVDKIRVTELPLGYWTENFKEKLEELASPSEDKDKNKIPAIIKDYEDMSKDTNVDFTITFVKDKLEELTNAKGEYGCNGIEKLLKLYTTNTTTNMHLFDANDTLQKYDKVTDIINAYYDIRLSLYQTRKEYMIENLEKELILLTNKAKYIKENLDGTIDLRNKNKEQVVGMLQSKGYKIIDDDSDYKYLVKMPMDSVTQENIERLYNECENKESQLEVIKKTTINKMWLDELEILTQQYIDYKEDRTKIMNGEDSKTKKKIQVKNIKKVIKKQNFVIEDN
jgi:DNA topoisomerase-2